MVSFRDIIRRCSATLCCLLFVVCCMYNLPSKSNKAQLFLYASDFRNRKLTLLEKISCSNHMASITLLAHDASPFWRLWKLAQTTWSLRIQSGLIMLFADIKWSKIAHFSTIKIIRLANKMIVKKLPSR